MKICDDYNAKVELWARNPKVCAMPKISDLPPFGSRKFRSYEEMNAWKHEYREQLALKGGAKWTKS
jgi:hypothetical protein